MIASQPLIRTQSNKIPHAEVPTKQIPKLINIDYILKGFHVRTLNIFIYVYILGETPG